MPGRRHDAPLTDLLWQKSDHRQHKPIIIIIRGVVNGEAKRMRRLNSTEPGYSTSLDNLENKCSRSNFPMNMVKDQLRQIRDKDMGQVRALERAENENDFDDIVWATSVPTLIKIDDKYQQLLNGSAQIKTVYKRPPQLRTKIKAFHYNKILNPSRNDAEGAGKSSPCGNCKCCGSYGAVTSMVKESAVAYSTTKETVNLKQQLTCKDAGIYQLRCKACIANNVSKIGTYVGMTCTSFNKRMSGHRTDFKTNIRIDPKNADRYALARHYKEKHANMALPTFEEAFELIFLEQPANMSEIRLSEDTWANKLKANLNVQKMVTTQVKF